MKKIEAGDAETRTKDLVEENVARLKELFPEAFVEGKIEFDTLKQLLGGSVDEREEKYGLNWHGKRRARQLALTPSTGTLRPCPTESVDWETTQNLVIEGDNLEVLKLLQKSYAGRVKLIYIDPPYNRGKDFIYPDDFTDTIKNYQMLTGQIDSDGRRLSSNAEASGRFHTDWLQMIYPRLKLARNLLSDDGAIFISIDDNEVDNLKKVCCEIFGEENFVAIISVLVNPRGRHLDKFIAKTHDSIVVFVKNADNAHSIVGQAKEGQMLDEYDKEDEIGKYRELGLRNRNQAFNPRTRPNLFFPLYVDPSTGKVGLDNVPPFTEEVLPVTSDGIETCWTWSRDKVRSDNALLTATRMDDGSWRVFRKDYLLGEDGEVATTLAKSLWVDKEFNNDYGRKAVKELFGSPIMDFPKSPALLRKIVEIGSKDGDIVLDFFAGSGTTGQAVFEMNSLGLGQRRLILVQLPEPTRRQKENGSWEESAAWKAGFATIADVTKERLRRSAKHISDANPMFRGDLGFRVFKLDSSNIRPWNPQPENIGQQLLDAADHIMPGRTPTDVLYELLLKLGLDLCIQFEQREIAGKEVISVGAGTLIVCLADNIETRVIENLAIGISRWHTELAPAGESQVVFRDSAFADDVAKTNLTKILEQHGLENVRSI